MALRRVGLGARRSTVRLTSGCGEQLNGKLAEVAHHEIGAAVAQGTAFAPASNSDHEAKAAAATGLHAGLRVLDDGRLGWRHAEAARRFEEHGRVGLAGELQAISVDAVDDDIDQLGETGGVEDLATVVAGRGDGDRQGGRT